MRLSWTNYKYADRLEFLFHCSALVERWSKNGPPQAPLLLLPDSCRPSSFDQPEFISLSISYMPTLPDNPGVSWIQNESPGLPHVYQNLPDKSDFEPLHHLSPYVPKSEAWRPLRKHVRTWEIGRFSVTGKRHLKCLTWRCILHVSIYWNVLWKMSPENSPRFP